MVNEALECSHGPVSTMPGHMVEVAPGLAFCNEHPDVDAAFRVQGETDSMGCEYLYLCVPCGHGLRLAKLTAAPVDGYCDWHKGEGSDIKPHRDYDEGMSGPVYRVCGACRKAELEAAHEELRQQRIDSIELNEFDYDPEDDWFDDREVVPGLYVESLDPDDAAEAHVRDMAQVMVFDDEFDDLVTPATRIALYRERAYTGFTINCPNITRRTK